MAGTGWMLAVAAAFVLTSGCASGPDGPLVANANSTSASPGTTAVTSQQKVKVYDKSDAGDDDMHCTRFQPTGSHRIITRCVSQEQRQLEEDAARNTLLKSTGPVLTPPVDF